MTSPTPQRPNGVPTGRILTWTIVALLVLIGVYLYFRYGRDVAPVLG